jgi:lipopolysaccharide transport system ATP-binding protein
MYVRLAFAVIAHVDADVLIVDEALSVGDAYFVQKCMRFLRAFMDRGTLLFVSHDIGAVTNLCSRALWLERGKVVEIGAPREIVKHYLEGLASETQDVSVAKQAFVEAPTAQAKRETVDMRDILINTSSLRNDIKVIAFQPGSDAYGAGGAQIIDAALVEPMTGHQLSYLVGGEYVKLIIKAKALQRQTIFGDNSFLTYRLDTQSVPEGKEVYGSFEFKMPVLPVGDYAITVAIATGSQEAHVQQHWIHDAILFHAQASRILFGLVGIPMSKIEIKTL